MNIMAFIDSKDQLNRQKEENIINEYLYSHKMSCENVFYYYEERDSTNAFEKCIFDLQKQHFDYMIAVSRQSISHFKDDIVLLKSVLDQTHTIFIDLELNINYLVTDLLISGSKKDAIFKKKISCVNSSDQKSDKNKSYSLIGKVFFSLLGLVTFVFNAIISIIIFMISFLIMFI